MKDYRRINNIDESQTATQRAGNTLQEGNFHGMFHSMHKPQTITKAEIAPAYEPDHSLGIPVEMRNHQSTPSSWKMFL